MPLSEELIVYLLYLLYLLLLRRTWNESKGVDLVEKLVNRSDSRVRPGVFGKLNNVVRQTILLSSPKKTDRFSLADIQPTISVFSLLDYGE